MHDKSPFVGAYKLIILGHNHLCLTVSFHCLHTIRFYKDFYERFVKIGDSPKIILVYIPDKDYIMSNSSFFETAIYVYRGINEDDFNKKGPEYKHYLNNMFLLS